MGEQTSIASRTLQLESNQLDYEFHKVIDHAVDGVNLPTASQEIKLLLKFLITNSLLKSGQTIGSKIYKLRIVSEDSSKTSPSLKSNDVLLYSTLNIIIPYLLQRKDAIREYLQKILGTREAPRLDIDYPILVYRAMSVVNFIVFMMQGRYLSIPERISRLLPVISDKDYGASLAINRVQMELLNREIIWRELASFLTTVIPYIRTEEIKYRMLQFLGSFGVGTSRGATTIDRNVGHQVDLYSCGICDNQPFNPYTIGCRHVFCYYCLESRHLLVPKAGYSCQKCNYTTEDVSDVRRHKVYTAD